MGEEHRLFKTGALIRDAGRGCDTGEGGKAPLGKGEGHERGAGLGDGVAELAGDVVGEAGRAHLGDRPAAGRHHQVARAHRAARALMVDLGAKALIVMGETRQ